jgi:hypothetical protein
MICLFSSSLLFLLASPMQAPQSFRMEFGQDALLRGIAPFLRKRHSSPGPYHFSAEIASGQLGFTLVVRETFRKDNKEAFVRVERVGSDTKIEANGIAICEVGVRSAMETALRTSIIAAAPDLSGNGVDVKFSKSKAEYLVSFSPRPAFPGSDAVVVLDTRGRLLKILRSH